MFPAPSWAHGHCVIFSPNSQWMSLWCSTEQSHSLTNILRFFFSAYYDQLTVQKIVCVKFVFQFSHNSTFLIWPLQKLSIILLEDFFNCVHVSSLTLLYRYLPRTNPSPSIAKQTVASRVGCFISSHESGSHYRPGAAGLKSMFCSCRYVLGFNFLFNLNKLLPLSNIQCSAFWLSLFVSELLLLLETGFLRHLGLNPRVTACFLKSIPNTPYGCMCMKSKSNCK